MSTSSDNNIDLTKIFGLVVQTMNQNQSALNEADSYNHDHGDNMVQIFDVITQAMKAKDGTSPADQLEYASELLRNKSAGGSAKIYSEGLSDAAKEFAGKSSLSADNISQLLQLLLGAAPTTAGATSTDSDLLGSLLGGLTSSVADQNSSQSRQEDQGAIDVGDLVNAGMAFFQTKQSGGSTLNALMSALASSSRVGSQDYRTQSGALVASALINAVGQLAKSKK